MSNKRQIYINSDWFPMEDIDIKKPAQYLIRFKDDTYKNCISIIRITEATWQNGWFYINGDSRNLDNFKIESHLIAGPIKFK